MVASFRDSLDAWLERILPADVYFRAASGGDTAYLTAGRPGDDRGAARRAARRVPARAAAAARSGAAAVVLLARSVDPADSGARAAASSARRSRWPPRAPPPVWVSEARGRPLRLRAGERHRAADRRRASSASPSPASGATTRASRARSRWSAPRYIALTGDRTATTGALWLRRGRATGAAIEASIRRDIPGGERLEIALPGEIRAASLHGVRPHVRGDLRAGARGGGHRARRPVVVVRRAGARAPPRVRRAAPPRHDAAADRRDARDRGRRGQRHRARRRPRAWAS